MIQKKDKKDLPSLAYETGYSYEQTYRGCAQCALAAIMDVIGEANDDVFRSATSFAGGTAVTSRGTCGAMNAGIMIISSKYGRERINFEDKEKIRKKCHRLCRKLMEKFKKKYGSIICGDIQTVLMGRSFDLLNENDYEEFDRSGAHDNHCPSVVGNAAKWTLEILIEEEDKE
ncbi:MAG: C-GCAxxG-C-C family protein [Desulfobacterales bacterium]|nr:C-GCAxxG-C-C family protein [Desulfobacterales bacterium]